MTGKKILFLTALTFTIFTAGLILTSCGAASYMGGGDATYDYAVEESYAPAPEYAMDGSEEGDISTKRVNGEVGQSSLRHVIRNGSMDLAVQDTRGTMRKIREMVNDAEGIVSNSYVYEMREGQYGGYMTLRIPERLFDPFMEQLETFGKATNIQTSIEDVTMQYVDLESRLNNQLAQEARLVEILDMADTVEDVLEVEKELYHIRGEIESMTAQLTYLKDQVSYATINLNLREETIPTEVISPGAFDNFGKRIQQAFIGSINFVLNAFSVIIIAFIAMLPVLILIGFIVLIIWLLVKKLSGRRKNKVEEPVEIAGKPKQ
ncbi:MAG: DUF4349 domain-containing protein [Bacillota bacterium]|nr:DUF4349 domain-containing protein [Bacillota bacterium]